MRPWILLAGINGAAAVIMAAIGAHGVTAAAAVWIDRASQFQLMHALALLAVDRLAQNAGGMARAAGGLFVLGIFAFCGSLYVRALMGPLPVPMVTPAGGVAFIGGWLCLGMAGIRLPRNPTV